LRETFLASTVGRAAGRQRKSCSLFSAWLCYRLFDLASMIVADGFSERAALLVFVGSYFRAQAVNQAANFFNPPFKND